jgi:hypothetical protein
MKLTIEIGEKTYEELLKKSLTKDSKGVEKVTARTVERFADVPDSDRVLVLRAPERREIEKVFQTTIENGAELIDKVRRLSAVGIGHVIRPLTTGETIALKEQAFFHGYSVEDWVKIVSDQVMTEIMGRV